MGIKEDALALHKKLRGKIEIKSKVPIDDLKILSLLYTPGVAAVSMEIANDSSKVFENTWKGNSLAIVTDGTRVLGLGNIGPEAALPVMEGKSLLFKVFGNVDAVPICLDTKDTEEIVRIVKSIAPSFGAINLEDIESPRCFELFDALNGKIDIPVFHDDRQGTGMVASAALVNSLKILNKKMSEAKIVIAGAGAAGYGISKLLKAVGAQNMIVTDSKGIIYSGRENLNKYKEEIASYTNREKVQGTLADAMKGSDVIIAASAVPGLVTKEMIKSMNADPIVFALSNPDPEINPDEAKEAGAAIIATGRSDYPNQINNVLVFPGVMRGALDANVTVINEEMMVGGIHALANIMQDELDKEHILPAANDKRILPAVSNAVKEAAIKTGVARK